MEVHEHRVDATDDAVNGAIVKVEEAQGAFVASLTLDIRHGQHVVEVEDVGVQVRTIDTIRDGRGQPLQVRVPHVLLNLDVIERQRGNLLVDALFRAVFIPITHGLYLNKSHALVRAWCFQILLFCREMPGP